MKSYFPSLLIKYLLTTIELSRLEINNLNNPFKKDTVQKLLEQYKVKFDDKERYALLKVAQLYKEKNMQNRKNY